MKEVTVCSKCGCRDIDYLGKGKCFCHNCNEEVEARDIYIATPQERLRAKVYATGNKWAIENFNATHNW